jgi:hypothetical protein
MSGMFAVMAMIAVYAQPPNAPEPWAEYHLQHTRDQWQWPVVDINGWTNQINISRAVSSIQPVVLPVNFTVVVYVITDQCGVVWDWGEWGLACDDQGWLIWSAFSVTANITHIPMSAPTSGTHWVAVTNQGGLHTVDNWGDTNQPWSQHGEPSPSNPNYNPLLPITALDHAARLVWGRSWIGQLGWWVLFAEQLNRTQLLQVTPPTLSLVCLNMVADINRAQLDAGEWYINWTDLIVDPNLPLTSASVATSSNWNVTIRSLQQHHLHTWVGSDLVQVGSLTIWNKTLGQTHPLRLQPRNYVLTASSRLRMTFTAGYSSSNACPRPGIIEITIQPPLQSLALVDLVTHPIIMTVGVVGVFHWFWVATLYWQPMWSLAWSDPASVEFNAAYLHVVGLGLNVAYLVVNLLYFYNHLSLVEGQVAFAALTLAFVFTAVSSGLRSATYHCQQGCDVWRVNTHRAAWLLAMVVTGLLVWVYTQWAVEEEEGRLVELIASGLAVVRSCLFLWVFGWWPLTTEQWIDRMTIVGGMSCYVGGGLLQWYALWLRFNTLQEWNRGRFADAGYGSDVRQVYETPASLMVAVHVLFVVGSCVFVFDACRRSHLHHYQLIVAH